LHDEPDEGGGPGTEIAALLQNGACPEVFRAMNMASCFGYMSKVGPDTIAAFSVPWWFRTTFNVPARAERFQSVIVNGVIGEADVWVDGTLVASHATVQGAYTRYTFPVTKLLHAGANAVALEVYPNDPTKMFTLDNVDWTQIPPDNNTGIQFPVELHESGALSIANAHVSQQDSADLSSAALTVKAEVINNSEEKQAGTLSATIAPPDGGAPITVSKTVKVPAGATRTVSIDPPEAPQLQISHPEVWWPYGMGSHPLYGLATSISQPHTPADSQSETFAVRTVTSSLVGPSELAPSGARQFAVDGRPLLFRAGGWAEDLFLRYSAQRTTDQIALIENLGLNGIRTEGNEMPADFYEQMDRAGILVDAGFQCCDNWQREEGEREYTAHELKVIGLSALTIGQRLRNHPSILDYSWSDNAPTPKQEAVSLKNFAAADFQDPLIASAEYKSAPQLGPAGEKEGPYDWVPPSYWYDTSHFDPEDPTRTNVGGAWAFNSEASAGATVPTLDSIQRFMSSSEQAQLWQAPDYNQYHLNYEPELPSEENFGYSFGTLHDLDRAIAARYGAWPSLAGYVQQAQVANYETQRAEFEAYIAHSHATATTPSTGVVYWQLNKGWPTLLWDLYNYEYDQAGSYFGAQEANAPLHAIYSYDSGGVSVDNLSGSDAEGLSVTARVYDAKGKLLDEQSASALNVPAGGVAGSVLTPKVPAATAPPQAAKTYFVELLLSRSGEQVDRNVYWLSTQPDQVNWPSTIGKPQATMSQYADLRELQSLAPAEVSVSARSHPGSGADGADTVTEVTLTNTSKTPAVAFFLRADIRRGSSAGVPASGDNEVLPVFWSANDTTLWPGESQTLRASYRAAALEGQSPVVSVAGWNVPASNTAAP
ncbi:MAG: glycosyl hydrolase 2 galactose-binding domain-containing protein, partial [Solirubrobacteraceae bacterium]